MTRISPLKPLKGAQADASDPRRLVWLSASAGTGKTHVLTARVIRLLLGGADPAAILCLTFTKAGAAEMADRIHARLASWVRMPDARLAEDLRALGEDYAPAARDGARTLFAKVLDATGGGLRIQTIHAFCQTLLGGFPSEAGLVPGFRLIEDREAQALGRAALATMLVEAEAGGDLSLVADVQVLSRRLGEERAEGFLRQCARAPIEMEALGSAPGIEPRLRRALDVPAGAIEAVIADRCGSLDTDTLARVRAANAGWASARGRDRTAAIDAWLAGDAAARAAGLDDLHKVWSTAGRLRSIASGHAPKVDGYGEDIAELHDACAALLALRAKAAFATLLAAGLRAGQAYARGWVQAKRAAGAVDFDDLIRTAVALLASEGIGDWVRYKLDQRTDHILVDEAQDTNPQQWAIVGALAEEFFATEPDPHERVRTLFTVGDFKQAIFGFQGTDPLAFEAAATIFRTRAALSQRVFEELSLDLSFRSTEPVLALVDALIAHLGSGALGLGGEAPPHRAARRGPGQVVLWPPIATDADAADPDADGEEGWLDDATRLFADRLARQVRDWLAEGAWLACRDRPIRPEDVMVLVRKRGDLASLLVARLHAHGVPVAGVDRLRLDAPLAVKDLLAAARFAIQPEDDLTLANLLVSPLFGVTQDALFDLAYDRDRATLLSRVRADPAHAATAAALAAILAAADRVTPYRFFEELLSGPLDGRRKLLRRLGSEARDPIDELLNAALSFEDEGQPSLQPFLDWFDRGEVQIKRDPSAPLDAVRVMTVHGAKGLQAPLVVLADATGDPDRSPVGGVSLPIEDFAVPSLRPRADERFAPFDDLIAAAQARERQEHWRLLYVAATRAEERLVVGGALGARDKGVPPPSSWYAAIAAALDGLETATVDDPVWGAMRVHAGGSDPVRRPRRAPPAGSPPPLPGWLHAPAPVEQRPSRPLAPSAIGRDDVADAPPVPAMRAAAERGRLLHALFERLPGAPPARRHDAAIGWLTGSAGVDPATAAALADDACAVIGDPRFAALFGPDALAEAPIAAVVDGIVVAGTADRLLVTDTMAMVVDFKTGRRAPVGLATVPDHHLAQIAAYAAALAAIFPDRAVRAALLYTAGPTLIEVDANTLAAHKPALPAGEQSLASAG